MTRKCTAPAHSKARSSAKRAALAKNTVGLTGTRAERWYGSNWIRREKRRAIYNRDNRVCVYCGSSHDLTLDHVVSAESGGTNDATNLVTACRKCNSRKGALTLRAFARMVAAETGTTTRTITNRVRKQLSLKLDVRTAKAQLAEERDARAEREAIESANAGGFLPEVFEFDFAA